MAEYKALINNVPPSGFRWQVFRKGTPKAVKSGTAKSEAEANAAAQAEIDKLSKEDNAPSKTKK